MADFKDMLKDAKPLRRTVPICLRGDLVAKFEELERQLTEAERETQGTLSIEDELPALRIAREMEDIRDQMREHTYTFVIEAMPGPEYRSLKAKHPPRIGEDAEIVAEDRIIDADYTTFFEPLLRACCVDPFLDDETWADLEPKLSDQQYNELAGMALYVNRGRVDIPFSQAASRHLQRNASE